MIDRGEYDVTEEECPDCEEGSLWVNSFEIVCDECGVVRRKDKKVTVEVSTPDDYFYENRDEFTYSNGEVKMVGGFDRAYPKAEPGLDDDPFLFTDPY